jgi:type II secretion system protein N
MRLLQPLAAAVGYLLFTLAVLAFMLWYQFPAGAAKARLEAELNRITPGLQWNIGKVGLGLPASVVVSGISISTTDQPKQSLVTVQSFSLQPDLWACLQGKRLAAGYTMNLLRGQVQGRLHLQSDQVLLEYDGTARGLNLQGLQLIRRQFDRKVTGTLSATFSGSRQLQAKESSLSGRIGIADGILSFQEPVLGMEQLSFGHLSSDVEYSPDKMVLTKGSMDASLLSATFSGTVIPADKFALSSLRIKGELTPRSEFLATVGNAAAVSLLKENLQQGKLPFTINGTVRKPGIVFTGLPAALNRQLQGGRSKP